MKIDDMGADKFNNMGEEIFLNFFYHITLKLCLFHKLL